MIIHLTLSIKKLSANLSTKVKQQNQITQLVKAQHVKQRELKRFAQMAMKRMDENNRRIADRRRRADGFGAFAVRFHDSIQNITSEISDVEEDMRRFRQTEGELIKLNVKLANAEAELEEVLELLCEKNKRTWLTLYGIFRQLAR